MFTFGKGKEKAQNTATFIGVPGTFGISFAIGHEALGDDTAPHDDIPISENDLKNDINIDREIKNILQAGPNLPRQTTSDACKPKTIEGPKDVPFHAISEHELGGLKSTMKTPGEAHASMAVEDAWLHRKNHAKTCRHRLCQGAIDTEAAARAQTQVDSIAHALRHHDRGTTTGMEGLKDTGLTHTNQGKETARRLAQWDTKAAGWVEADKGAAEVLNAIKQPEESHLVQFKLIKEQTRRTALKAQEAMEKKWLQEEKEKADRLAEFDR